MATSKKFLVDYLLESPTQGQSHHLQGASLEVLWMVRHIGNAYLL